MKRQRQWGSEAAGQSGTEQLVYVTQISNDRKVPSPPPACLSLSLPAQDDTFSWLHLDFLASVPKKKIKHNNNNNNEIKWKKSKRKAPHRQFRVQGYCASFFPLLSPLEGGSASCSFANFIDSLLGRCQECIRWVGDCCFSWAWAALEGTSIIVPSSLSLSFCYFSQLFYLLLLSALFSTASAA